MLFQSPILIVTFCILLSVHFAYFFIIKKITNISIRAGILAFFAGCIVWYLVYLLALGPNASATIDLLVADVQIDGKQFIKDQQAITYQFLSSLSPWEGNQSLATVLMPALVEELGKIASLIGIYFVFRKTKLKGRIQNASTALGTMSIIALGFACAENIQYVLVATKNMSIDMNFLRLGAVRFIFLPLIHMSFALYSGYAFGKILFLMWEMLDEHKIKKLRLIFHSKKKIKIYQSGILIGGVCVSIILHAIYNYFLESGMPAAALIVSFGVLVVFFLFLLGDTSTYRYQTLIEKIQREQKLIRLKKQR